MAQYSQALDVFPPYHYHKVAATILSIKFSQLCAMQKLENSGDARDSLPQEFLCPSYGHMVLASGRVLFELSEHRLWIWAVLPFQTQECASASAHQGPFSGF